MAFWAAAAAAIQAFSAIQQGNAANAAAKFNARVAKQNAVRSEEQAAEEERRQRVMARKQLGSMRAGYAASGVTMEGSPLDALEESAATAELDALTIRHAGAVQAAGFRNDARLEKFKGKSAQRAGYFQAASSVLQLGSRSNYSQSSNSLRLS